MRLREELPEFSTDMKWLNGHVTKANLIGEVPTLVHFWSISCHLCENTFRIIAKWKNTHGKKFQLVGIHMPRSKDDINNALIHEKANQLNMTNPIALDHDLIVSKEYANRTVPSFYLFDKHGLLRHVQSGENGFKLLEKRLILLMNER
ncbi:TlpA family protein disulfide reductase [Psychrobacillus sp. NPDC096426]|uniref:TlpA family protein disulfide reductase n=1 Tax=Psychrobacillus sp. NPDC096426 TaxID=3364491 RepID=UPI00382B64A2